MQMDQSFLMSGDLRVALAISQPGSDQYEHFLKTIEGDQMLEVRDNKIRYTAESRHKWKYLQDVLYKAQPFTNKNGQNVYMGGQYDGGTCVIVGSGPSANLQAAAKFQQAGATIMTLGNASWVYKDSDIWVGRRDLSHYNIRALESSRTLAFLPKGFLHQPLWNHSTKSFMTQEVRHMPNVLFYEATNKSITAFLGAPDVSGFAPPKLHTTLAYGYSIAVLLGFRTILFTGVDMGGTLDNYFIFDEIPHKALYTEKTEAYANISKVFSTVVSQLQEHTVRTFQLDRPQLSNVPVLSSEYLTSYLTHVSPYTSQVKTISGATIPHLIKTKLEDLQHQVRNASVTSKDIADIMGELLNVPRFNTKEFKKTFNDYQRELAKPGGCNSCAKGKYGRPFYAEFVKAIQDNDEVVQKIWQDQIPDKYTLAVNGKMHFREDKKVLQDEFERLTKQA